MAAVIEHQTGEALRGDAAARGREHTGRTRGWVIAAIAVALVLMGVGVVVGRATASDGDDVDAAVMAPIEAFDTAWEEHDADGILAVVTDGFTEEYRYVEQLDDGRLLRNDESWDGEQASSYATTSSYVIDLIGDPVVVGEGPWFVVVAENQTGGGHEYEGTASYVVVDDGSGPKLAMKLWVGSRELIRDD